MRSSLVVLAVSVLPTFGSAAEVPEGPVMCDPTYELGPSGSLPPGTGVWVQQGDLGGSSPACTAESWLQRHKEWLQEQGRDDALKVCTVGENGFDVGPGPFGQYYDDPETGRKADKRVLICRGQDGECFICPDLTS